MFLSPLSLSRCMTLHLAARVAGETCLRQLAQMARCGCLTFVIWSTAPLSMRIHSTIHCCVSAGTSRIPTILQQWPWMVWRWGTDRLPYKLQQLDFLDELTDLVSACKALWRRRALHKCLIFGIWERAVDTDCKKPSFWEKCCNELFYGVVHCIVHCSFSKCIEVHTCWISILTLL